MKDLHAGIFYIWSFTQCLGVLNCHTIYVWQNTRVWILAFVFLKTPPFTSQVSSWKYLVFYDIYLFPWDSPPQVLQLTLRAEELQMGETSFLPGREIQFNI